MQRKFIVAPDSHVAELVTSTLVTNEEQRKEYEEVCNGLYLIASAQFEVPYVVLVIESEHYADQLVMQ